MASKFVKPENLGSEFDTAENIEAGKIRLKLGSGLEREADGAINVLAPQYAQLRNATAPNVNANIDWGTVPMGITDFTQGQFAISGDGIECQFTGVIKATAHLSYFGNQTIRTNPIIRLAGPAATPQIVQGKSGYIRHGSGHNESSVDIPGIMFNVVAGEVVTVEVKRETTAGGVVTIPVGGSFLLVERVS